MTSSYMPKPGEVKADWHVIDATDLVLGRMAARVAMILQGKHKPTYSPSVDTGDFVIIVNAEKVKVTGRKAESREYQTYSYYPTGQHRYTYREMNAKHPEKVIELSVRRMLPKNKLARHMLSKLKVYRGEQHPHAAQQPTELKLAI
jgi:large subunit ribosomal protein L13